MPGPAVSSRDLLFLQGIVLIWGITSILGKSITLPPEAVVIWRTGIASVALGAWLTLRRTKVGLGTWEIRALLNGCLIGLHWYLFFLAPRLGNVSVALTGLATSALWVSLLEPLVVRGRRLQFRECLLAFLVAGGVALVSQSGDVPLPCLLTGIASAAVAALFSIFNASLARHLAPVTMSCLEMVSATAFCAVLTLVTMNPAAGPSWIPAASDWAPLLTLSLVCTVFAFSVCIWLQQRVPPFTIGLAANLEPVYGMALAALIFGSTEVMGARFYAGSAVIIGCLIVHTLASRQQA